MKEKLAVSLLILLILFSGCTSFSPKNPPESHSPVDSSESDQPEPHEKKPSNGMPTLIPASPEIITTVENSIKAAEIKGLYCESATPGAIMNNGDLILWGGNVFYGIGNGKGGDDEIGPFPPTKHQFPNPVTDVFSSIVSYAITENGDLYGWGQNYYNQLVCDEEFVSIPHKINLNFPVKQALSPGPFSLLLSTEGDVYTTGVDVTRYKTVMEFRHSIAGYIEEELETDFRTLGLPFKCQSVDASAVAHIFLTEEGEVYYQGLLLGDHTYTSPDFYHKTPYKIDFPEKIVDVSATDFNIIALSDSGKVYVYGHPLSGISDAETDIQIGEDLFQKRLEDIISISSGEFVAMAISQDGRAYCWGLDMFGIIDEKNNNGDLPSSFELIPEPRDMGYSGVTSGMVGLYNGTVLCDDGTAHIWGNNSIGQIIELQ